MLAETTSVEPSIRTSKVLIIDDDRAMRDLLSTILRDDYIVASCSSGQAGLDILRHQDFDVVLLDIMLGDANGLEILRQLKTFNDKTEVIMITVVKDLRTAIGAMKLGAFDYITKNFEYDEVKRIVHKALEQRRLKGENQSLKNEISQYTQIDYIQGLSARMAEVNKVILRIAAMPSSVLIQGESGTGKEVIARRIHGFSLTPDDTMHRPFITVNVASIPDNLLESILFGHERGSFTGAIKQHRGKFELANGGTLFLDEISELKLELQAKLLRAIQEREIERVGGEHPIPVDVRIIAATNKDLLDLVGKGRFREDLYYRLNVIPMQLPPLRERLEDIPEFVNLFIKKYAGKLGNKVSSVTKGVLDCFQAYSWPGNIRELENVIERLVALATGETIAEEDLPIELRFLNSKNEAGQFEYDEFLKRALAAFEKRFIMQALNRNSWRLNKTADTIGIHRKTLEYKIKRLDLQEVVDIKRVLRRQEQ